MVARGQGAGRRIPESGAHKSTEAPAFTLLLPDLAATRRLGEALAAGLEGGEVILLAGPLGAGKTTLVQAIAAGMGCRDRVTSPTFVLVRRYSGRPGTPALVHVDLYRLTKPGAGDLGLEEAVDAGEVLVVEWPEDGPAWLVTDALQLELVVVDHARTVTIGATGATSRRLLAHLAMVLE